MAQKPSDNPGSGQQLLTQKEYADRKGWSKQYVNQLVKKGRIPLKDGRIDPEVADAALAKSRDPAQDRTFKTAPMTAEILKDEAGHPLAPTAQSSFSKVRTVREYYRALREQLEYEQLTGKLVPLSDVKASCTYAAIEIRNGYRVATMRAGQAVAAKFHLEEREVLEVIKAEINVALTELNRRFREKCMELQEEQSLDSDDAE